MTTNKNAIIEIIFTSIKEVNENQPSDNRLKLKKDEFLVSDKSKIDSLGLITLLVNIEDKINKTYNVDLNLLEENFISDEKTPFQTIDNLAEWLHNNVK